MKSCYMMQGTLISNSTPISLVSVIVYGFEAILHAPNARENKNGFMSIFYIICDYV